MTAVQKERYPEPTDLDMELAMYLSATAKGASKAIKSKDLSDWGSGVEVRRAVHRLRVAGFPICSYKYGYYYADTLQELTATLYSLRSRYYAIRQAYKGLYAVYEDSAKAGKLDRDIDKAVSSIKNTYKDVILPPDAE